MIPLDNKQLRWYGKDGKFELIVFVLMNLKTMYY